jgi:phospholipid/cholesterol/gamma-HCH transport system permease protein
MPHRITLTGPVTLASLAETRARLGAGPAAAVVDLSGVTAMDTAGAWLLVSRRHASADTGEGIGVVGVNPAQTLLLRTMAVAMPTTPERLTVSSQKVFHR